MIYIKIHCSLSKHLTIVVEVVNIKRLCEHDVD